MNAWVLLIAACCVISGAHGQYGPVRGHYGPALAFAPAAGFAGAGGPYAAGPYAANPYAASAAAAALGAGAGATQLTLAPPAAVFGHAHHQQALAPGFPAGAGYGLLGAAYGAQGPSSVIVSPVLHQDGVAGLMPAGAPNFAARSTVTHYGGGGSSQITRYQPTSYTLGGASAGATGSRTQYQSAQLTAAPGSTSALYREPKQLPSLSSLHQVQSAAAPAGATVTVQEVGQSQLGAFGGYGGGAAGLFSGYGGASAAAAPRTASYGYGAGLRAY
ncbi:spidroin-2 [Dermacentor silvarum]|uniref:spidroin-2 n=1 Tax=Dermacentor silvarum TaxID=543639 RepID=UPI001898F2E0|nr:spidroin-2 [Dermacentor silvarum]